MKKVMTIHNMNCGHCKAKVENALNDIPGVIAKVDLGKKEAMVTLSADVSDELLMKTVRDIGYDPISIREKKGLFG